MIEFKNITKKYGSFTAIEGISFNVEPSSIYGLIGYNVPRYEQKTLSIT